VSYVGASLCMQKLRIGSAKHFCNIDQLNIGNKAFAGFYTLYRIFVHIQPRDLQTVGKFSLGNIHFFSELCDVFAAYIVLTVFVFVDKHIIIPHLTFSA